MASTETEPFSFDVLDGLVLAATRGRLGPKPEMPGYFVQDVGPWLELRHLIAETNGGLCDIPSWIVADTIAALDARMRDAQGRVVHDANNSRVFLSTAGKGANEEALSLLTLEIQKSSTLVGISKPILLQIRAALGEMIDNVIEHSERSDSGFAVCQAMPGSLEFCVYDRGVGIRHSLAERYGPGLDDPAALRLALQPQVSRHPKEMARGHGFDRLVLGMINLNAQLRFRSGDACLSFSGVGAALPSAHLTRRPSLSGFLVSAKFYSERPRHS